MHAIADQYANTSGDNTAAIILVIVGIIAYWVPTIVALIRRPHPDLGPVIVWNFFAFFFAFPWIIAMVKAVASTRPQRVTVQYQPRGGYK